MTIRLSWTDENAGVFEEDAHRIYRAPYRFTAGTLPAPLATIPANAVQYDDVDPPSGQLYYAVAAVRGTQQALSDVVPIFNSNIPSLGPVVLARSSATQSLTANTLAEVALGTELIDNQDCFASNRITVPATMAGRLAVISAGVSTASNANSIEAHIQTSGDGGSSWNTLAIQSNRLSANAIACGAVRVSTGLLIRVAAVSNGNATIQNSAQTFLACAFLGPT